MPCEYKTHIRPGLTLIQRSLILGYLYNKPSSLSVVNRDGLSFSSITNISESLTLNETASATFFCSVNANPFDESTVEWDFPDRVYAGSSKWSDRSTVQVELL